MYCKAMSDHLAKSIFQRTLLQVGLGIAAIGISQQNQNLIISLTHLPHRPYPFRRDARLPGENLSYLLRINETPTEDDGKVRLFRRAAKELSLFAQRFLDKRLLGIGAPRQRGKEGHKYRWPGKAAG